MAFFATRPFFFCNTRTHLSRSGVVVLIVPPAPISCEDLVPFFPSFCERTWVPPPGKIPFLSAKWFAKSSEIHATAFSFLPPTLSCNPKVRSFFPPLPFFFPRKAGCLFINSIDQSLCSARDKKTLLPLLPFSSPSSIWWSYEVSRGMKDVYVSPSRDH